MCSIIRIFSAGSALGMNIEEPSGVPAEEAPVAERLDVRTAGEVWSTRFTAADAAVCAALLSPATLADADTVALLLDKLGDTESASSGASRQRSGDRGAAAGGRGHQRTHCRRAVPSGKNSARATAQRWKRSSRKLRRCRRRTGRASPVRTGFMPRESGWTARRRAGRLELSLWLPW